jgi:hypothetical protein
MSNDLTKVSPILLAQGLMALRGYNVMPRLINSDYQGMASEKNSVINVPIPSAITTNDVTPANVPPSTQDVAPTSVPITLDQWKEAAFYLTDNDVMQAIAGVIPMQASEAIKSLANTVNAYIFSMYKNFYGYAGTAGTTPFASDTTALRDVRKIMNNQLCPTSDRRLVLSLDAEGNAIVLPLFQQANTSGTTTTQVEGVIGRKMGYDWFSDQQVPTHTSTALTAGAATVNGAHSAGAKTVSIAKATNTSPLVKGDIITFAGDTQTYVVTADVTLAVGNTNVSIEPGLATAKSGGEAMSLKASHVVNLAFHRDAIAFATRPLLAVSHPSVITNQASDPVSGITLRLEITREYKRTRFAYDMLYGAQVVRREFGCRLAG